MSGHDAEPLEQVRALEDRARRLIDKGADSDGALADAVAQSEADRANGELPDVGVLAALVLRAEQP